MLDYHMLFRRICGFIKEKSIPAQAAAAAAVVIFVAVLPNTGAAGSSAMAETIYQPFVREEDEEEIQRLAGNLAGSLLEEDVRKRQETDALFKIQAEETKKTYLERESEKIRQAEERAREEKRLAEKNRQHQEALAVKNAMTEEDYRVLLKIVEAEAGICDEKGRILVANVIMNRVKSSKFPDSVKAVVYQTSQFSPVGNGFIDRVQVSEKTKVSVDRALAGEDYSRGALYFMNRSKSQSKAVSWFDTSLTYLFQHGGHEFFK